MLLLKLSLHYLGDFCVLLSISRHKALIDYVVAKALYLIISIIYKSRLLKLEPKLSGKISEEESTKHRKCPICGKEFDSIAEAQKHMTIEHMQKGETNTP
jgi:hypothetical protein